MTPRTPANALILAEDETQLVLDRRMLRRLGVARPVFFSSGRKALDHLAAIAARAKCRAVGEDACAVSFEQPVDILICNERLADMSGLQFLAYVRRTSGLAHIPALLLVGNRQSPMAQAAFACNSCAVLVRPYAEDDVRTALAAATMPDALHAPLVLPASFAERFGQGRNSLGERPALSALPLSKENRVKDTTRRTLHPVPAPDNADGLFRAGFAALQSGDWNKAETLLQKSYGLDPAHAETCLALSRAAAEQGKEEDVRTWLCRTGLAHLRGNARTKAREVFSRLPRGKSGQTPLLREAGNALQNGEATAAALMFMEAHALDPGVPLHAMISRVCLFTQTPEEHMRGLVKALSDAGHSATAGRLRLRLLQVNEPEAPESESGFLARHPILNDILCVAGHTFKTWRTAA